MSCDKLPLSELLRPRQLSELTLPQSTIDRFQRMISAKKVMNMLFYGRPGVGKTSAARLFATSAGLDAIEISGASLINADSVRHKVEPFASSVSMSGEQKICVIDEADSMARPADSALRPLIEKAYGHCAFILTANREDKLSPGLRSRLLHVSFDIPGTERQAVIERWLPILETKLTSAGIEYDLQRLREIVGIWSDLRRLADLIDFEFC